MEIDFSEKPKQELTIELVPETSWFTNVRSLVPTAEWDRIRKKAYTAAGYQCEICGGVGPKWPVECHEIWDYDDEAHTQTLRGLIALCPSCHHVKHIGLAGVLGRGDQAKRHLASVNGWTLKQANNYIKAAFAQWTARSKHEWDVDVSYLEEYKRT